MKITLTPLVIAFQEQSYSSLHSGLSLAWEHFHDIIANPCSNWLSPNANAAIGDSAGADADCCVTQ